MQIGYSTWSTKNMAPEEAIRQLARIGFDCVELDLVKGNVGSLENLDPGRRKEIRRLLDETGLALTGLVSSHRNQIVGSDGYREGREIYKRELDLAVEWAKDGQVPAMDVAMGGHENDWDQLKERIAEGVAETVQLSAERGAVVALEPHSGNAVNTPERMRWVIEKVNHPNCRINFDISHFNVIGVPIEHSVALMAPYTAHTHIKDESGRFPDHQFLIPGEGEFDYVRYLQAMQEHGWTGDVTCEISLMVQRRPNYDAVAAMQQTYDVLLDAFEKSGVPREKRR